MLCCDDSLFFNRSMRWNPGQNGLKANIGVTGSQNQEMMCVLGKKKRGRRRGVGWDGAQKIIFGRQVYKYQHSR